MPSADGWRQGRARDPGTGRHAAGCQPAALATAKESSNRALSVAEAAARLHVAPNTVYVLCQKGRLTHHRVGRAIGLGAAGRPASLRNRQPIRLISPPTPVLDIRRCPQASPSLSPRTPRRRLAERRRCLSLPGGCRRASWVARRWYSSMSAGRRRMARPTR
jgi:excisionase family DNA binding protein